MGSRRETSYGVIFASFGVGKTTAQHRTVRKQNPATCPDGWTPVLSENCQFEKQIQYGVFHMSMVSGTNLRYTSISYVLSNRQMQV